MPVHNPCAPPAFEPSTLPEHRSELQLAASLGQRLLASLWDGRIIFAPLLVGIDWFFTYFGEEALKCQLHTTSTSLHAFGCFAAINLAFIGKQQIIDKKNLVIQAGNYPDNRIPSNQKHLLGCNNSHFFIQNIPAKKRDFVSLIDAPFTFNSEKPFMRKLARSSRTLAVI